jgi:hypothetical protein
MHNSCKCALITMTGAIVLAAATIVVGFSAVGLEGGDHLSAWPARPVGVQFPANLRNAGDPIPDSYLANRS